MAPETRSQDFRRIDESLEAANQRISGLEARMDARMDAQSDDLTQIKLMIKELATQQGFISHTLQSRNGEASSSQDQRPAQDPTPTSQPGWMGEGPQSIYKPRKPRRDFPTFEGEGVHKWLYKCNQYFDLEEIPEGEKLRLASYYLDGMALYWHQNFTRNLEGGELTWTEYVEALCCRFGCQRDPLEELTEHRQEGDLEEYIKDFDELWNRAQISEKQALVFFLGGLELEIKNLVKMFEPKSLKQAYNLARLHNNTLTHRKITPHYPRSHGQMYSPSPLVNPFIMLPVPRQPTAKGRLTHQPCYPLPQPILPTITLPTLAINQPDLLEPEKWTKGEPRGSVSGVRRNSSQDTNVRIGGYTPSVSWKMKKRTPKKESLWRP